MPIIINKRFFYALLSIALVAISSLVQSMAWLAILWMVPLLFALHGLSPIKAFILTMLCGTGFWMASTWWLVPAFVDFTGTALLPALILYAVLCAVQALPYGLFAFIYRRFSLDTQPVGPLLAAAVLTICLMLPSLIPGMPLHALHVYAKWLAIVDISGLSLLVFTSSLLQLLLVRCLQTDNGNTSRKIFAAPALLLLVSVVFYSGYRDLQYQREKQQAGPEQWISMGMIQPNLRRADNTDRLYRLSEQLLENNKPDLLVWPEFPPAFSVIENAGNKQKTLAFTAKHNQPLLAVSGYVFAETGSVAGVRPYYNATHLIRDGEIEAAYYKRRLVPFFEYLPGRNYYQKMQSWFPGVLHYIPGYDASPIAYNNSIKMAVAICYEAIFPRLVHDSIKKGGNVLVNPVSDTWFGQSPGSQYHFSLARFRAMEHRIPWLRVANSGISAAVEANGEVISGSQTSLDTIVVGSYRMFVPQSRTLYSRYGDWLTPLLWLFIFLWLTFRGIHHARNH